jgi:hypothetical protein
VKPYEVVQVYEDGTTIADLDLSECKVERGAYQAGYQDAIADAYAALKSSDVPEFYLMFLKRIGWKEPT